LRLAEWSNWWVNGFVLVLRHSVENCSKDVVSFFVVVATV